MARGTNPSLADIPQNVVAEVMRNVSPLFKAEPVNGKDSVQVEARITEYFEQCERTGSLPTVEAMALALGIRRETLWKWSVGQGCSFDTMVAVSRAKEILSAVDAELALRGKINPVCYIFRSKNYYGLKDSVEVQQVIPEQTRSIEEIVKRYTNVVDV